MNYTAKDLKNVTKAELVDLLKKEGIEFEPSAPYFELRALLISKSNESKEDESMKKKPEQEEKQVIVEETVEQKVEETAAPVETKEVEQPKEEKKAEEPKEEKIEQPKAKVFTKSTLMSELAKRKGAFNKGMSAFNAELAKRRGERVSGMTFAQELKNRQLKFGK